MKHLFIAIPLCIFILAGCKKSSNELDPVTYTFRNPYGISLTMDVYRTEDDYNNNRNRENRITISPYSSYQREFQPLEEKWLDWYSDDMVTHNWVNTTGGFIEAAPYKKFTAAAVNDNLTFHAPGNDYSRKFLLGDGTGSAWKIMAQYNGTLVNTPVRHEFAFKKDFSATFTYDDGTLRKSPQAVAMASTSQPTSGLFLQITDNAQTTLMAYITGGGEMGADTLQCFLQAFPQGNYILVRQ